MCCFVRFRVAKREGFDAMRALDAEDKSDTC